MKSAGGAAVVAPVAVAAAVLAVILVAVSAQPVGVFWDDGVYLITAKALAAGEGYRFVHLPGAPPAVHYPPGWPLLLAAVWSVVPDYPANLTIFRLINPVLAALGAGLACAYAARRLALPPIAAAVVVVIFATTLPVLVLDSVLFAEPAFFVVLICALAAADRAAESDGWRAAALAGVLVGCAALVRSTGLVLIPAVAGALLLARQPRGAAVATATALALILPWQWWSGVAAAELDPALRGNYGPYLPWLMDAIRERGSPFVAAIVKQNAIALHRTLSVVFFPVGLREIRPLLVSLLVVALSLGVAVSWRRTRTLALFLVGYLLLVLIWPYAPDRFAWAVWPLVGVLLAVGAREAVAVARHAASPWLARGAATLLCGVVGVAAAGIVFYTARGASRGWVDVAQRRNAARLAPVAEWVRSQTPADAVIATDGEPLIHLQTGRRVVPVHQLSPDEYLAGTPLEIAASDLRALIIAGRADFAVLSGGSLELDAAELLGPGSGDPHLVRIDSLPGGGAAFRVSWPGTPPNRP